MSKMALKSFKSKVSYLLRALLKLSFPVFVLMIGGGSSSDSISSDDYWSTYSYLKACFLIVPIGLLGLFKSFALFSA